MKLFLRLRPLAVCLLLVFTSSLAFADSKIQVGVILPLTGALVASGESVRNSIQLADELYDTSNEVDFNFEDDGLQPKNSVNIAMKFIAEKIDAIIIFGTPTSLAVAPITEKAEVPLAAISIFDKVSQNRNFTMRHFVSWRVENELILREAARRQYKTVAIVTSINDATLALRDGFMNGTEAKVVLSEEFARGDMDFLTTATKIKNLKPDAIYHLLFSPQGSAFMKTLRSVGVKAPVFGVHNVEDPDEVAAAQGAYENIWYVTGDDREGAFYTQAYFKKYGSLPAMGGANAFDYAKMIIEGVRADKPLLPHLKNLKDFEGAFGRYSANKENAFDLKATLRAIKNSKFIDLN